MLSLFWWPIGETELGRRAVGLTILWSPKPWFVLLFSNQPLCQLTSGQEGFLQRINLLSCVGEGKRTYSVMWSREGNEGSDCFSHSVYPARPRLVFFSVTFSFRSTIWNCQFLSLLRTLHGKFCWFSVFATVGWDLTFYGVLNYVSPNCVWAALCIRIIFLSLFFSNSVFFILSFRVLAFLDGSCFFKKSSFPFQYLCLYLILPVRFPQVYYLTLSLRF